VIAVCAPTYDLTSPVELTPLTESTLQDISRRVSRTKTLDMNVSITDNGFSHGDRTLKISANVSEEKASVLYLMVQTYSLLTFSIEEGVFSGAVESYKNDNGKINMAVLIKEKLSED